MLSIALRTLLIALVLFMVLAGCKKVKQSIPNAADRALRDSPQLTLFSLDPDNEEKAEPGQRLHGFWILGETVLSPGDRRRVTQVFRHDISQWDGNLGMCFYPRQAIRATNNGTIYDFMICYECSNIQIFVNDSIDQLGITGSGNVFNEVLKAANIPISQPTRK